MIIGMFGTPGVLMRDLEDEYPDIEFSTIYSVDKTQYYGCECCSLSYDFIDRLTEGKPIILVGAEIPGMYEWLIAIRVPEHYDFNQVRESVINLVAWQNIMFELERSNRPTYHPREKSTEPIYKPRKRLM